MTLQGARGATFGASNAFFNTQILAAQTGGKIVNEEVEFTKYDILSLDDSKAVTLTATPSAATPAAKDFKVFSLASDNSLTTATPLAESEYELVQYEAAIGVTSENFASGTYYTKSDSGSATTYTPATEYAASTEYFVKIPCKIKVTAGNKGDKVLISYEAKATGEHMVAKADDSNELMNVTAEVLLRELCKEELYYAFIIIKGKLSGETEWSMTRDGNHAFEITAVPAYCDADKKLVEVIIVKGEDLVA